MGGDWGDDPGPDGIPPSGGATDHRNDGEVRGTQRVGVPIGIGFKGNRGGPTYWVVHQ